MFEAVFLEEKFLSELFIFKIDCFPMIKQTLKKISLTLLRIPTAKKNEHQKQKKVQKTEDMF